MSDEFCLLNYVSTCTGFVVLSGGTTIYDFEASSSNVIVALLKEGSGMKNSLLPVFLPVI